MDTLNKKLIFLVSLILALSLAGNILAAERRTEKEYLTEIGQHIRAGEMREAIECNKEMISKYPKNPRAYVCIGNIYNSQDNIENAILNAEKAIALLRKPVTKDDNNVLYHAHMVLSNAYTKQMKLPSAIEELKKSIEFNPESDFAHYAIGVLFTRLMKYKEAKEAFQKVVELADKGESKGKLTDYANQALKGLENKK